MYAMKTDKTDSLESLRRVGQEAAKRALQIIEAAITKSRRSRREIERALGWSQGYLGSILRGRIALKVWHVFALARELGFEPLSLFLTISPPRDPSWVLEQLGIEPAPAEASPPSEPPPPHVSREELEEMMRTLLREELARFGLAEPGEYPGEEHDGMAEEPLLAGSPDPLH